MFLSTSVLFATAISQQDSVPVEARLAQPESWEFSGT